MHRIYIEPENIAETEIMFPAEQSERIKKVLRLKVGDSVIIFDGLGKEYRVTIEKINQHEIAANIESMTVITRDPKLEITLMQGLPKFEKFDFIVQKATELGVKRIIPLITERTIPKLTPQKVKTRVNRWHKIACSAAEQSGRTVIPIISSIMNFQKGLEEIKSCELKLFFWEEERESNLKTILRKINQITSVAVIIGPEGGFTKEEAELAKQAGATSVSLGSRLLRTETAPITALSILLYEFSE
ncbi:MAG: 16S rRNA (uracil(1498)-N(3))-methyltransferase [bacterium]|nr:16S rRNA (uracil(1498)-N(3))-methyltransferase [bacterium]